ncbi:MAG TPA: alpha/beta fold hydrolase [Polyangiaceae bacterium]|jgi:pimeloyl-ACP methyl ester carboxylesterase|nr:alpha/beta fold hydrolase [Polyangiaceae bacterium]
MRALLPRRGDLTETLATLREVVLSPLDLLPSLPEGVRAGDDVVVLIHGFMASAGVFRPMRKALEDAGAKVASFSHAPGEGVARIAKKLVRLMAHLPHGAHVHLVGHSLGGVVARYYVQELHGARKVAQTISIASPFFGTRHAKLFPYLVGRDLHQESEVLDRLRARAHEHDVPHLSLVAEADRVVVPETSAMFPTGEVVSFRDKGHNSLLFDERSIALIVDRVRGFPRR